MTSRIVLDLKVVPRSSRPGFLGTMSDGTPRFGLASPPVDGRANRELAELLAAAFGTRRSAVEILSGAGGRRKRVAVSGATRRPDWFGA